MNLEKYETDAKPCSVYHFAHKVNKKTTVITEQVYEKKVIPDGIFKFTRGNLPPLPQPTYPPPPPLSHL